MAGLNPVLRLLNGPHEGREHDLARLPAVIGRDPQCQVAIDSTTISRAHAEIAAVPGGYAIKDLGSRNGVLVNNRQVGEVLLAHGDEITLGKVRLRFQLEPRALDAPPAAPAAVAPPAAPEGPVIEAGARPAGRARAVLFALLLAAAAALAGTVLWLSTRAAPPPPGLVMIREGEEKLVNLRQLVSYRSGADLAAEIVNGSPEVVRARFEDERDLRWILRLKAVGWGESLLALRRPDGSDLARFRIRVQGEMEKSSSRAEIEILSPEQRQEQARALAVEGSQIMVDDPYRAVQRFRRAMDLMEMQAEKREAYFEAKAQLARAEEALARRLAALWTAYQDARRNREPERALEVLKSIRGLVPDMNDLDYQKSVIFSAEIRRQLEAEEKAKAGR